MEMTKELAYLIGLVTGKGFIDKESITIDFPCNNEFIEGIAHCPVCGFLATKPTGQDKLQCKNKMCVKRSAADLDLSIKKIYNQAQSFRESINEIIIPFLKNGIQMKFSVLSSGSGTSVNLILPRDIHKSIEKMFHPYKSFSSFTIPEIMWTVTEEMKVEFVNGLLDTIGFANAGGWIPRDTYYGTGRMRVYFQVINRNYALPVAIDNYLRECFNLPVQTIDWGHPNIRDSNLKDYLAGNKSAMGREHQVKFYPEFYTKFKFRISSKQALFEELRMHNIMCRFTEKEDWFKGKVDLISLKKIKAAHPFENNPLIDPRVRMHFDAHWQINLRMGCKYLGKLQSQAADPELFAITGISEKIENRDLLLQNFKVQADKLKNEILKTARPNNKRVPARAADKSLTEQDTYPILKKWMENYIKNSLLKTGIVYITSEQTISNFMQDSTGERENHVNKFDNFDLMSIRPDLIAFNDTNNEFYFIESKITALGFKELGQILAYCHVANPSIAFLITTKDLSQGLRTALVSNPNIAKYGNNLSIKFGILKGNNVDMVYINE
jgi:hypothetical protein